MAYIVPVTVAEFDPFPATARAAGLDDATREEITDFLARNPESGAVIPGTGGIRKLRWTGRGKGKSGGYRIIYYFYNETAPICLLAMYAKNEREDLTPDQKARLSTLAGQLAEAFRRRQPLRRWRMRT
jgi:mRNA-degrading endonuclease RelE of RelBE toxin-antitoxin system